MTQEILRAIRKKKRLWKCSLCGRVTSTKEKMKDHFVERHEQAFADWLEVCAGVAECVHACVCMGLRMVHVCMFLLQPACGPPPLVPATPPPRPPTG